MTMKKRASIIDAAISVFAEKGFIHTKVEDIAKKARVATGTPYLYFDNKDDILIKIFEEQMAPIIELMRTEIGTRSTVEEKIKYIVFKHFELVQTTPDMAKLIMIELRQSDKFMHQYGGTIYKDYLNIIGQVFEEGQQEGIFRDNIHSTIFKQVLFGALDQITQNWTLSKTRRIDLSESANQIVDIILKGILKN
jgi:TetR/AcrR family fatty acid metabolism transcriptional regulator